MLNQRRWIIVVFLNSLLGIGFGHYPVTFEHISGMTLGILTWCAVYISLDWYLINANLLQTSQRLYRSAILRSFLQVFVVVDIYAGMAALTLVDFLQVKASGSELIIAYSSTVLTGLILSFLCSIIFLVLTLYDKVSAKL
jgi:hypothetical protein